MRRIFYQLLLSYIFGATKVGTFGEREESFEEESVKKFILLKDFIYLEEFKFCNSTLSS